MSDLIPPMMPDDLDALIQAMERVQHLEAEVARLRLTGDERTAFKLAGEWCCAYGGAVYSAGHAIDRFLERTK
jgi:hypothetical protein